MLKILQEQRQTHKLNMTQDLKQAISFLELNIFELGEFLENEALSNVFLDVELSFKTGFDTEDIKEKEYHYETEIYNDDYYYKTSELKNSNFLESLNSLYTTESLYDNLIFQLNFLTLEKEDKDNCKILIDNINEKGFLSSSLGLISKRYSIEKVKLKKALSIVQSFHPVGVGARNIEELVVIQLKNRGLYTPDHLNVLKSKLENIAYDKVNKIIKDTGLEREWVEEIISDIKTCNPNIVSEFNTNEVNLNYIYPEIVVKIENDDLLVFLKDELYPMVKLKNEYLSALYQSNKSSEEYKYFKNTYDKALYIINAINQRKVNTLNITKEIFTMQRDFFFGKNLKPLKMKDVALKLNISNSTVSRIVNGKYADTPKGVFPLKYFFVTAMQKENNEGNESVSDKEIKEKIASLINEENKKKPLSDEVLSKILKENGYVISRRTVAKYRESLNIPSSYMRKEE